MRSTRHWQGMSVDILIAEDDSVSREILRRALVRLGHECLTARDGNEAWEMFQRLPVDVVISDRLMPGIDGIELCRRVREHTGSGYPYFIFLTSMGDRQDLLAGMRAGADDYLTKPLDAYELRVRLIAAARLTSLHRRLSEQKDELERLNLQLQGQARRDPLTGLGNRLKLWEDLEALHGGVERYGRVYALAMCDVDFFKRYNDTWGHPAGDDVLRTVAGIITDDSRSSNQAYRYGGEEFLLILPDHSLDAAVSAIEHLRETVASRSIPHPGNTPPGIVTISAGIAVAVPGEDTTPEIVLREADTALYRAKTQGRNRVEAHVHQELSPLDGA
jgi:two-component system, cell cycle response regulator